MAQYRYNPDNLKYSKLDTGFRLTFWRVIAYIFATFFIAFVLNIFFILLFDSPKERMLRKENEELLHQYSVLLERKAIVDTVFKEINQTDENIFRLIFETEPSSSAYGELMANQYAQLDAISDEQIVFASADKLDSMLKKAREEELVYDFLRIKANDKAEMLLHIPAIQPLENDDLTRTASGFGYRMHPIYKIIMFHEGIDYTAQVGTPVYATADGTVEEVTRSRRGSGNRIIIDHGYGLKTVYAHLNEIRIRENRTVKRNDLIGTVGNSGLSSGPHLHYEVLFNEKPVNPINFFFLELSPEEYEKMITISKNSGQSFD
ncbi:M23 family metallopeptidase [Bacteroidota bacterium]